MKIELIKYRVSVNADQLTRVTGVDKSDFSNQAMLRDGVTPFPNRVYAEYEDKQLAELVYEQFRRQGLVVFRNWLDPEVIPVQDRPILEEMDIPVRQKVLQALIDWPVPEDLLSLIEIGPMQSSGLGYIQARTEFMRNRDIGLYAFFEGIDQPFFWFNSDLTHKGCVYVKNKETERIHLRLKPLLETEDLGKKSSLYVMVNTDYGQDHLVQFISSITNNPSLNFGTENGVKAEFSYFDGISIVVHFKVPTVALEFCKYIEDNYLVE